MSNEESPRRTGERWHLAEGLRHEALDGEHLVLLPDKNMVLRLDGDAARVFRTVADNADPGDADLEILDALAEHGVIVSH